SKLPPAEKKPLDALKEAFHVNARNLSAWPDPAVQAFLHGTEKTIPPFAGVLPRLRQRLEQTQDDEEGENLQNYVGYLSCPACGGARLNREARAVRFAGKFLHEVTALTVDDAITFFTAFAQASPAPKRSDQRVGSLLVGEILQRLRFLHEVGLGYVTLDRPAPTLSGGESQRARLAAYLGTGLLGVCYILDEPTIGLHPADTGRLLAALRGLQARGNTVVVVEHDQT